MVYAQLGQQPLARTTETSPEPRRGTLSCLSARPPDLDFWTGTRPRVVGVSPSIVPFLYSKRTAAARSLVSRYGRSIVFVAVTSTLAVEQPRRRTALATRRVRVLSLRGNSVLLCTGTTVRGTICQLRKKAHRAPLGRSVLSVSHATSTLSPRSLTLVSLQLCVKRPYGFTHAREA